MTHTIYDIATQLDRLCPSQVDTTKSGNGRQQAGHIGHDNCDNDFPGVGWYCNGGNVGYLVMVIHPDDIKAACERLAALPDGALDENGIKQEFVGLRVDWYI